MSVPKAFEQGDKAPARAAGRAQKRPPRGGGAGAARRAAGRVLPSDSAGAQQK